MQHGTGREAALEAVENVAAVLDRLQRTKGWPIRDLVVALERASEVLISTDDLDEPGVYGPDYSITATKRNPVGYIREEES